MIFHNPPRLTMKQMIEYISGTNVSLSRFFGKDNALAALASADSASFADIYAIVEFANPKGGSHFLPVQGVEKDRLGNIIGLNYIEGYNDFSDRPSFGIDDIISVATITEAE